MTALAYAVPVLVIAVCILAGCYLGRPGRPARPLSRRERAQWRHITRAYARGAELDELRARIARLEQDGSEDAR